MARRSAVFGRSLTEADQSWKLATLERGWVTTTVARLAELVDAAPLPGFVALDGDERVGLELNMDTGTSDHVAGRPSLTGLRRRQLPAMSTWPSAIAGRWYRTPSLMPTYYVARSNVVVVADVRLLVLVSVSDGPKHGYAIQTDIEDFAGIHLGPGTLYGALTSLERDGLVEALPTEQRRRPYRLTADGRQRLGQQLESLDRLRRRAVRAAT